MMGPTKYQMGKQSNTQSRMMGHVKIQLFNTRNVARLEKIIFVLVYESKYMKKLPNDDKWPKHQILGGPIDLKHIHYKKFLHGKFCGKGDIDVDSQNCTDCFDNRNQKIMNIIQKALNLDDKHLNSNISTVFFNFKLNSLELRKLQHDATKKEYIEAIKYIKQLTFLLYVKKNLIYKKDFKSLKELDFWKKLIFICAVYSEKLSENAVFKYIFKYSGIGKFYHEVKNEFDNAVKHDSEFDSCSKYLHPVLELQHIDYFRVLYDVLIKQENKKLEGWLSNSFFVVFYNLYHQINNKISRHNAKSSNFYISEIEPELCKLFNAINAYDLTKESLMIYLNTYEQKKVWQKTNIPNFKFDKNDSENEIQLIIKLSKVIYDLQSMYYNKQKWDINLNVKQQEILFLVVLLAKYRMGVYAVLPTFNNPILECFAFSVAQVKLQSSMQSFSYFGKGNNRISSKFDNNNNDKSPSEHWKQYMFKRSEISRDDMKNFRKKMSDFRLNMTTGMQAEEKRQMKDSEKNKKIQKSNFLCEMYKYSPEIVLDLVNNKLLIPAKIADHLTVLLWKLYIKKDVACKRFQESEKTESYKTTDCALSNSNLTCDCIKAYIDLCYKIPLQVRFSPLFYVMLYTIKFHYALYQKEQHYLTKIMQKAYQYSQNNNRKTGELPDSLKVNANEIIFICHILSKTKFNLAKSFGLKFSVLNHTKDELEQNELSGKNGPDGQESHYDIGVNYDVQTFRNIANSDGSSLFINEINEVFLGEKQLLINYANGLQEVYG